MVERVAIRPWAAGALVREYRLAASELALMSRELRSAVAEASDLLGDPTPAVAMMLEGVAIELADDGDDLSWRLDLIVRHDGSVDTHGRRIADLPERRPALSAFMANELAEVFAGLVDDGIVLDSRDRARLSEGLHEYVDNTYSERWGYVTDFWADELADENRQLSSELLDITRDMARHTPTLSQLQAVFDELAAQQHDPGYLAQFFRALGAENTAAVPLLLSDAAYSEALNVRRDIEFSADPIELRDSFATSLAVASKATTTDRIGSVHTVLGGGWFDDLFDEATWFENNWIADDEHHLNDTFPALFAAGEFRADIAERAGILGLSVFDHAVTVDRGWGSPLFAGFDEFETNWEDRAGLLTGAAARVPSAAAAVLIAETRSGRSGAQVVADRSYNHMDRDVVGAHYAELIFAGTVLAERKALADGIDTRALHDPLHAKAALIESVAEQVRQDTDEDPYPDAVNLVLTQMAVQTLPHFVQLPFRTDSAAVVVDIDEGAKAMPSTEAGIYVDPEYLQNFLGALFRHEEHRVEIVTALVFAQRQAYGANPTLETVRQVGKTDGAMVSAYNIANIDDAMAIGREINAANERADMLWNTIDFAMGHTPLPGARAIDKGLGGADELLGAFGVNPIEDFIHGDSSTIVETARREATSELFGIEPRAGRFVFANAFETMQAEYRGGGYDGLSLTSRTIFERMEAHPVIGPEFEVGETKLGELTSIGGDVTSEYHQLAGDLIGDSEELTIAIDRFVAGSLSAWPGESNE